MRERRESEMCEMNKETGLNIGNKIKYIYILFFLYYKIKEI